MTASGDSGRALVRPLLRIRQTVEFTEEPVDPGFIDAIADVARWSGSANNRQPWRFVVMSDKAIIGRIAEAGLPHTATLRTAPTAVAFVLPADPERAVVDAYDDGRAAERVLIAASMLGLGAAISWIRDDVLPAVRGVLEVPEDHMVRTVVAVGHPAEQALLPRSARGRARLPRDQTVYAERWRG